MLDFILLAIIAVVTWCAASEGVWGAAFVVLSVLLSGLLAMNLFEPLAMLLEGMFGGPRAGFYCDIIALLGLFGLGVFGLRAATDYLMPTYVQVHPLIYDVGRFGLGLVAGYLTMAIIATSLHTAPLPRSFAGFEPGPNNRMLFGLAPDRQWLAFTQYVSEQSLRRGASRRILDGAQFRLVDSSNIATAAPAPVWSSFPIRYADRRAQFAAGAAVGGGGSAGPPQGGPPPTTTPSGGGGSSGF